MERNAKPKPERGEFKRERRSRRIKAEKTLETNKAKSKARDGLVCRWPGCHCKWSKYYKTVLESAHIEDKSTGGSDETENLITVCSDRHRGTPSLHSKDLKIEKLTPQGADGLLAFYERDPLTGEMKHAFTEKYIGVAEPRKP